MTNPRQPAFSKVLYVVPVDTDVEATGAVQTGVLSGQTAISSNTTAANGVSALSRHFIPMNAPEQGGIDYGTAAQNRAAQREECEQLIADRGADGSIVEICYTVFGNTD